MTFTEALVNMFASVPEGDMFFIVFIAAGLAFILIPPWGSDEDD